MRPSVLFAGDANADIILSGLAQPPQEDREVFCRGFRAALGGSTTICAAAYARLGGRGEFMGLVGDDEYGRLVRSELSAAGVGTRGLALSKAVRTGVTVSMVYASSRTQVTYPGSLATADASAEISAALPRFSHLHISGIYGTPAFLPRVPGLLAEAKAAGLSTSIDTQWDSSGAWAYVDECLPSLSYLFVNEDEAVSLATRLTGARPPDFAAAWLALAERTPCPVVKLGPAGAYADRRHFAPLPTEVVDTTGAGDTFAAAFLYGRLEEGLPLADAVSLGNAAGATACTYEGGASPELSLERVKKLLA